MVKTEGYLINSTQIYTITTLSGKRKPPAAVPSKLFVPPLPRAVAGDAESLALFSPLVVSSGTTPYDI